LLLLLLLLMMMMMEMPSQILTVARTVYTGHRENMLCIGLF